MAVSRKHKTVLRVLFAAYLVLLVYFLFFSEEFGRTGNDKTFRYNLVLFQEINRFVKYRNRVGTLSFLINVFGNVLAFIPLGFFLPALFGKEQKLFLVTAESFIFSLLVEIVQLFSYTGSFDVDDIILNTLGGFLGYIAYRLIHILYQHVYKKMKKRTKRKG